MREVREAGEEAADGGVGSGKHEMLAVGIGEADMDKIPPLPLCSMVDRGIGNDASMHRIKE
jgi:hypothetical protein